MASILLPWSTYSSPVREFIESEGIVYAVGDGFLPLGENLSAPQLRNYTVNDICTWQGTTLVATDSGVFALVEDHSKVVATAFPPMAGYHRRATEFFPFGSNELFIGTQDGLFALKGEATEWPQINTEINQIISAGDGAVWAATDQGLLKVSPDPANIPAPDVSRVVSYQGLLWAVSGNGLIVCERANNYTVLPAYVVHDLALFGGHLLMGAKSGLYEVTRNKSRGDRLQDQIIVKQLSARPCLHLFIGGSLAVVVSSDGAYELLPAGLREPALVGPNVMVHAVREIGGQKWLLTSDGAFLLSDSLPRRLTPSALDCFDAVSFQDSLVLASDRGLFALFQGGELQLDISQESDRISALLQNLLRYAYVTGVVRLRANYSSPQVSLPDFIKARSLNPNFKAIVATTQSEFEDLSRRSQWLPLEAISRRLSLGANELHIRVRDQWGNELRETKKLWAFPRASLITAMVTTFGCAFIVFCFLTYRRFAFSRRVLFNPFLNLKWLGLVPLAVSLCRPIRSYLLVLYSRTLAAKATDRLGNSTVASVLDKLLTAEVLEKTATSHRSNVVVNQQAGTPNLSLFTLRLIQKLYFDSPAYHLRRRYVAVFLDRIHNADKSLSQVFAGTMESYGGIDNDRLNEKLFAQDGYHFFICVDEAFEELPGFIDEHEAGNKITVVSNSILSELEALNIQPVITKASDAV